MLSFAVEFPVKKISAEKFIEAAKKWVLGSPHTNFVDEDLKNMESENKFFAQKGGHFVETIKINSKDGENCGVKHVMRDDGVDWVTLSVFSKFNDEAWASVRTYRESSRLVVDLPSAKKPQIVRIILKDIGGDKDGDLKVSALPHEMKDE